MSSFQSSSTFRECRERVRIRFIDVALAILKSCIQHRCARGYFSLVCLVPPLRNGYLYIHNYIEILP